MSRRKDRDLGMHRKITRRDFVNGVGVAVGGALIAPGWLSAREGAPAASQAQEYYPPALTGMRGSHPGSFEVAHALRDGTTFPDVADTGEHCTSSNQSGPMGLFRKRDFLPVHRPARCA